MGDSYKPVKTIRALAQRERKNGDTARVGLGVGTWGEDGVLRHPGGVSTLAACSAFVFSDTFLQVHRPFVRLGSDPDVVYSVYGSHGQKAKAAVSRYRIFERPPAMSC
jgi:hypothetical protein